MTREKIILPVAKQAGLTSFGTLRQFKNALGTGKIGHTGVLDNFADGLLICLIGSGTKLSPYFTGCDKRYTAFFVFGTETDTLDYFGTVTAETALPLFSDFMAVLPSFTGKQQQIPPHYSGVQVNGMRSYKAAHAGTPLALPARDIAVYTLELLTYELADDGRHLKTATLDIHCSKGTYIRSLCRDIAQRCGSVGFVGALRRTQVGLFQLSESLGADLLPDFVELCTSRDESLRRDAARKKNKVGSAFTRAQIEEKAFAFTPGVAQTLGILGVELKPAFLPDFQHGKPIEKNWFLLSEQGTDTIAVFCENRFCGMVQDDQGEHTFIYRFVISENGVE